MIGIFGGTFDPVHYGHIKPALAVKQKLKLSQIRFIPNRTPPHREAPWLSVEQRLSLLKTALSDYPDVVIDQRELDRTGPSYMIDTLSSLKDEFPAESFVLIIGMDVFFDITSWHRWRSLFDLCHLVVTTRPGFEQSEIAEHMSDEDYRFLTDRMTGDVSALRPQETGKILLQSVPQLDISATQIRDKLLGGGDLSQWMPEKAHQKLRGLLGTL
ncbi:MAG: nicotinate-nucleotide adenylyltransferase [Gammaproteobacteria bacterium]